MLITQPAKVTEVFLILHERANRPLDREFEYMTGRLRAELQNGEFGPALDPDAEMRARILGERLRGFELKSIVTESFVTPAETARVIAMAAGLNPTSQIRYDSRMLEGDLSYLSQSRFDELGNIEADGDPNATLKDWMNQNPRDFDALVAAHISVWNDTVQEFVGNRIAFVLHVEGFLLLTALLLGLDAKKLGRIQISRGSPVHVRLHPERDVVVSITNEYFWTRQSRTPFGQYG